MQTTNWFPALMVFSTVVFGTIAFALTWEFLRDWVRRRTTAKRLKAVMRGQHMGEARALELLREGATDDRQLGSLLERLPWTSRIRTLMRQSRLDWSFETFLLLSIGFGFGSGIGTLLAARSLTAAVIAAFIGTLIPHWYANRRRKALFRSFEEQFPEAIDLLTRAIRAGHPLSAGMRMVAEEAPAVVAEEFRQTFEEQRFGLPFQDAILGLVDRMDMVDVRIFVIAILIQREVGGNLAEILDNLAETIRGRFYIRRQLRVYTAQGRLSGWILASLPPTVGFVIFLLQSDYVMVLFTTTIGLFMMATALTLQIIGVLWIRRIVDIEI